MEGRENTFFKLQLLFDLELFVSVQKIQLKKE